MDRILMLFEELNWRRYPDDWLLAWVTLLWCVLMAVLVAAAVVGAIGALVIG